MNKKIGLVLEGGGFRGIYGAGPLDYFIEKGIEFPYVIGVSMGACNGASFITKQIGRNLKVPYTYLNDRRYISFRRLFKKGELFGMNFIFNQIPLDLIPWDFDYFNKSNTKFVVVTTDCRTGKPFYIEDFKRYDVMEAMKASTSLPFASKMVKIQNRELLDGGISDSIPVKKALDDGCDKLVVILTRPKGYRKSPLRVKRLGKMMYRKYPELHESLMKRHIVYNRTLDKIDALEKQGKAFVIRPDKKIRMGLVERNREKLKTVFEIGYNQTEEYFDAFLEFLK